MTSNIYNPIPTDPTPLPTVDGSSIFVTDATHDRIEMAASSLELGSDEDHNAEDVDAPTVILPMQLASLEDAGCSDIGRQRDHNEDYFGIETTLEKAHWSAGQMLHARGLYILCDGMGGHDSGEVASRLATETLSRYFRQYWEATAQPSQEARLPPREVIEQGIRIANQTLYDLNQAGARSGSGRMGTTLVMVLIQDTDAVVAHVGDSRLYRFTRRQGLEQLTIDHEVGQREMARGVEREIAYGRPDAYQLTQALGPRDGNFIRPDILSFKLEEDTLLLLASDGLTDNQLLETHWHTHLEPLVSSKTNLLAGTDQLIKLANQYNGHDNITAIAIRLKVKPNFDPV